MDYLNVPIEMLDRPIEPWTPKQGDRVRVARIGECQQVWHPDSPAGRKGIRGHQMEFEGAIGIVLAVGVYAQDGPAKGTHPYIVAFDQDVTLPDGVTAWGSSFAAYELDRLEPEW